MKATLFQDGLCALIDRRAEGGGGEVRIVMGLLHKRIADEREGAVAAITNSRS